MKLIIGLGNIGETYQRTRHNAGFAFVDNFIYGQKFSLDKKLDSEIIRTKEFTLIKPQSFMNESGRAVRKVMDYYKISIEDIVVVHDDLDIRMGEYKIQKGIGPKIHNGVLSVEQYLGTNNFWRVRIGVDSRVSGFQYPSGADYVLSKLNKEESLILAEVISEAKRELLVTLGLEVK